MDEKTQKLVTTTTETVEEYKVKTPKTLEEAVQLKQDLVYFLAMKEKIEEQRKKIKQPLDESIKEIQKFFKKPAEKLEDIERRLKETIKVYLDSRSFLLSPEKIKTLCEELGVYYRTTKEPVLLNTNNIPVEFLTFTKEGKQAALAGLFKDSVKIEEKEIMAFKK